MWPSSRVATASRQQRCTAPTPLSPPQSPVAPEPASRQARDGCVWRAKPPDRFAAVARSPADTPNRPVGVVIVDDQALFRRAVRAVVDATPGFAFLGEGMRGEDAVSLAAQVHPDLMLVDYRLPGLSGLEACARLARLRPRPLIVLVSADADPALPELAVDHGAAGFL